MFSPGQNLAGYRLLVRLHQSLGYQHWLVESPEGEQLSLWLAELEQLHQEYLPEELPRVPKHSQLLEVITSGQTQKYYFIVSAPLQGLSLQQLCRKPNVLAPDRAAQIIYQVAQGLSKLYASLDTIFRQKLELVPEAIYLEPSGSIRLCLPLLILRPALIQPTVAHSSSVSVGFLSPEAANNQTTDLRSHVFSLGCLTSYLVSGQSPYQAASDQLTLESIRQGKPPQLPEFLSPELKEAVNRCLQTSPSARYNQVDEFLGALDNYLHQYLDPTSPDLAFIAQRALETTQQDLHPAATMNSKNHPDPHEGVDSSEPSSCTDDTTPQAPDRGQLLNNHRFELLDKLGAGGMGEVYRVMDKELGEVVALKLILPEAQAEAQSIERLKREVRLARRISSPHICRIFDLVDLGDGDRGLTMSLIEGDSLSELLRSGLAADYQRLARWGKQVAEGLRAAHEVEIIHRDLKPENIMIDAQDRAIILDFGIARLEKSSDQKENLTQAGMIMGTPLYMSPEQLSNQPLDGRSDLYALGLILGDLITKKVPYRGSSYPEILHKRVIEAKPYRIHEHDAEVPQALATIIDALLAPAASQRVQTAEEAAQMLEYYLEHGSLLPSAVPLHAEQLPQAHAAVPTSVESQLEPIMKEQPNSLKAATWGLITVLLLLAGAIAYKQGVFGDQSPDGQASPQETVSQVPKTPAKIVAPEARMPPKEEPLAATKAVEKAAQPQAKPQVKNRPAKTKKRSVLPPPEEM